MMRTLRTRARDTAADLAGRLLKPATRAEVFILYLLAIVLTVIGLHLRSNDLTRIGEQATYTRAVQVEGATGSACLLDVMERVAPLLERVPSVEQSLNAYVRLEAGLHHGVACPTR
jgi:hypothetical protein